MSKNEIIIRGARTHNLKNVNLTLPRDKFCVITGLSGSGKSSLAFDTLYAEGQRRYVESLSAYARQFLQLMDKPDVDNIEGLSPAISIEQKSTSHNPRSTVGTITEIHDYLRLLFARVGTAYCPKHHIALKAKTITQMVEDILKKFPVQSKILVLAPVIRGRKGQYSALFSKLAKEGYIRVRVDGNVYDLSDPPELNLRTKHNIEVVVDRLVIKEDSKQRLYDSIEIALKLAQGLLLISPLNSNGDEDELLYSSNYSCPKCGYAIDELEPRNFSFNNPHGACPECDGLGVKMIFDINKLIKPYLSVAQGALVGFAPYVNSYNYKLITNICRSQGIDIDTPFEKLDKKSKDFLINGTDKSITIKINKDGIIIDKQVSYPGIINHYNRLLSNCTSQERNEHYHQYMTSQICPSCLGKRLKEQYCNVLIAKKSLPDISSLSIAQCFEFFDKLKLDEQDSVIASKLLKEIKDRLNFLISVGLNYLTLSRQADTLSGGEAQRIRLASQIGAGLVGVMYVLDEPSIGLHQKDNRKLLDALCHLRDLGNSVIVVEHDEDAIREADYLVDIGPKAGVHGGEVVACGSVDDLINNDRSITGKFLSGKERIQIVKKKPISSEFLELKGCCANNLKNIDVKIPVGAFVVVTGVSGSGKSTLINDTLVSACQLYLNQTIPENYKNLAKSFKEIEGLENFDKIICIDQSPIGRTPRSNPATYVDFFKNIRELFSQTHEARARGYDMGRFSFNVKGGRCEACQGDGTIKVAMHFMPDIYVTCQECQGQRYNEQTLDIKYKNKSISDVLNMTVEEAYEFFKAIPAIARKLKTLIDVGLSYITIGQSSTTFSGGEAQRIKLAKELSKRSTGKTIYVLDEPTTGLHFYDVKQLIEVLLKLRDEGNTIIVIEHNLDVIKMADYIIDLGPEGGDLGGEVVFMGKCEDIVKAKNSYTAEFLAPYLKRGY